MKDSWRLALQIVLPFLALSCGVGMVVFLLTTRPEAERVEQPSLGLLVETRSLVSGRYEVAVEAHGTVVPAQKVMLRAEVGGRVTWQADELVPGGLFREGDPLLRIDPRDYRLALAAGSAEIDRAQLDLEIERSHQTVAQREWELFDEERAPADEAGRQLALREPQVRTARVTVEAARNRVRRARLDLSRTAPTAAFDCMVMAEDVDAGQVVSPQTTLATLVGTDRFWVQVSVPVEVLSAIDVPRRGGDPGSPAVVRHDAGVESVVRRGRVVRLLPDLDPVGRMARLLVEIEDPLGLAAEAPPGLPLLLGSYVTLSIDARPLDNVIEVPRQAVRDGQRVFVMGDDGRLQIREITIVWRREATVLVAAGVRSGERVVTSRVPSPVDGMMLRTRDGEPAPTAGGARAERGAP